MRAAYLLVFWLMVACRGPEDSGDVDPPGFQIETTLDHEVPDWAVAYGEEFWKAEEADLSAALDRVRHAMRWQGAVGEVRAQGFTAVFDGDGFELRSEAEPARVGVSTWRCGDGPTISMPGDGYSVGNVVQRRIGEVVEHAEVTGAGVALSWILQASPCDADLTVSVPIDGLDRLAVGDAWVVDAGGNRVGVGVVASAQGIDIHVPGGVLAAAQYPMAVDPVISPVFPISDIARMDGVVEPVVAFDGARYLVVVRDLEGLRVARVLPDNTPLDPVGLSIVVSRTASNHAVAGSAGGFLVAWVDFNTGSSLYEAKYLRIDGADGAPIGAARTLWSGVPNMPSRSVAVASNGTDFLAAARVGSELRGQRIRGADGAELDGTGFVIESSSTLPGARLVGASDGTDYLMAWLQGSDDSLVARRVGADGSLLDVAPIQLAAPASISVPVPGGVASNGTDYLVTWRKGSDILGGRVRASDGAALDSGLVLAMALNQATEASVASDGSDYLVVTTYEDPTPTVVGVRVTAAGAVLDSPPSTLATDGVQRNLRWADVAYGGTTYLVAMSAAGTSPVGRKTHAIRVEPSSGAGLDGAGNPVCGTRQTLWNDVSVARSNSAFLVAWVDNRHDPNRRDDAVHAARVDATSLRVVDPVSLQVARPGETVSSLSAASNGTDFLVAHNSAVGLHTSRVTAVGALLDDPTTGYTAGTTDASIASVIDVASNGTDYYLVWRDGTAINGTRVLASDGTWPDGGAAQVTDGGGGSAGYPTVAADGVDYVVVWKDDRAVDDHIYGNRVRSSDGAVVFGTDVRIASDIGKDLRYPQVGILGGVSLVVHLRSTGEVAGTRVDPAALAALGTVNFPITLDPTSFGTLALTRAGPDFLAVWCTDNFDTTCDLRGMRIRPSDGTMLDGTWADNGFAIRAGVAESRSVAGAGSVDGPTLLAHMTRDPWERLEGVWVGTDLDADLDGFDGTVDCDDNDSDRFPGNVEVCDGKDNNCDGTLLADETDADGDGHTPIGACVGAADDCDDGDASVYPGNNEVCDGKDNDCNSTADDGLSTDADSDGHYAVGGCATPSDDCDDDNAAVHPQASEVCDGVDNDCDDTLLALEQDGDGDGATPIGACVGSADDCDDDDATMYPANVEVCDGKDNDCANGIDDGLSTDADNDGHYTSGSCATPNDDCHDGDATVHPGATEVCNSTDNDCNGTPDDPPDTDNDGFTTCAGDCNDNDGAVYPWAPEACDGVDQNCDATDDWREDDADNDGHRICDGDCEDGEPTVHPAAPTEICDTFDTNCDGTLLSDETDGDGDGQPVCAGDCDDTDRTVFSGAPELCDQRDNDCSGAPGADEDDPDGDGWPACLGDCAPTDATIHPGQTEVCGNTTDEDCDGIAWDCTGDDGDGDGFCDGWLACTDGGEPRDCDDTANSVFPGATETCDGADENCNGAVDEGLSPDLDDDGFTDVGACLGSADDCDDRDSAVRPNAHEVCDGIDNNCDQALHPGELDLDGDGSLSCAGDCADGDDTVRPGLAEDCTDGKDNDCNGEIDEDRDQDADGVRTCDGDCGDDDSAVNPTAAETCDGRDEDCDLEVDEGYDVDQDGNTTCAGDCDDNDATRFAGQIETCNGIDDDCDGAADDEADADGDGAPACADCEDADATIEPGATEVCADGIDQDCDGWDPVCPGYDDDGDGYCEGPTCLDGSQPGDCNDLDAAFGPGASESCDGVDNNCNGLVDEGLDVDDDNDGYTTAASCGGSRDDCDDLDANTHPGATEVCDGVDNDCDGSPGSDETDGDADGVRICEGDCDDGNGGIFPGQAEDCGDGVDNDCDGAVDEAIDADLDGYGACSGDCDDLDAAVHPGAEEDCVGGVDDDCDGDIDGQDADCDLGPTDSDDSGEPDGSGRGGAKQDGCGCSTAAPSSAWLAGLAATGWLFYWVSKVGREKGWNHKRQ